MIIKPNECYCNIKITNDITETQFQKIKKLQLNTNKKLNKILNSKKQKNKIIKYW